MEEVTARYSLRFPLALTTLEAGMLMKFFSRIGKQAFPLMGISRQVYDWLKDVATNGEPWETMTVYVDAAEIGSLKAVFDGYLEGNEKLILSNAVNQLSELEKKLRITNPEILHSSR